MAKEPTPLPPKMGHNSEARASELLLLMDEFRPALDAVEAAKALVKKADQDYAVVRNKAVTAGFTLKTIDKALKFERQPNNRKGQQAEADEEYFIFKTLGLPVAAAQGELNLGTDEERDEANWGDHGYAAGIRGEIAKPPPDCPPHFHQAWLNRRADGVEYSAWAKTEQGAKPDQRPPAGAGDPAPEVEKAPKKNAKNVDPLIQ